MLICQAQLRVIKKIIISFLKKKRLYIFQADIANMPFKDNVFDRTFCFGVLQHTPVIKKTLIELIKKTKKKVDLLLLIFILTKDFGLY